MGTAGEDAQARVAECPRAASWYARHGLRVHPLRAGGKRPLLERWPERATTDIATIAGWWRDWPDAGIAIATGAVSGVIVLDVDPRHDGEDSLAKVEREHGPLPDTWRALTPGGGLHLYLRHPGGSIGNRAGLWPGIDVRGDGGYAVAAPTVLDNGRQYDWELGHAPHELPPADPPVWLLGRLRGHSHGPARSPAWWRALVLDGADVGARNDAVARLTGHLLRRGVDSYVTLGLVTAWNAQRCRPPLSEDEVMRTVDSIARRELARRRAREAVA